jgi:ribosomal protein S8
MKIPEFFEKIGKYFFIFIKKYWFYLSLFLVVIMFFVNSIASIVSISVFAVVLIFYYLISSNLKYKLLRYMKEYDFIEDIQISEELTIPLKLVREVMRSIAKRQKRKDWLIAIINYRCVFYNSIFIAKFIDLYNEGLNEKGIFNVLINTYSIRSRAEVKVIEEILIKENKIDERDYSVIKLLTFESKL